MEATTRAAYAYVATALEEHLSKNTPAVEGVDHEVRMLVMMFERHAATGTTLGEAIAHRLELDDEGRELLAELKRRPRTNAPPEEIREACKRFHNALIEILKLSEAESKIAHVAADAVRIEPIFVSPTHESSAAEALANRKHLEAEIDSLSAALAVRKREIATLTAALEAARSGPTGEDTAHVGPAFMRSHHEFADVVRELGDYLGVSAVAEIVPSVKKIASELQDATPELGRLRAALRRHRLALLVAVAQWSDYQGGVAPSDFTIDPTNKLLDRCGSDELVGPGGSRFKASTQAMQAFISGGAT